jgi:hypothetical protein
MNGATAVTKSRADVNADSSAKSAVSASSTIDHSGIGTAATKPVPGEPSFGTTVATIGVIGVSAVLFDVALIPGIVIGIAAAYAPKYVPGLGDRLGSLFTYTVRGAYKMTRSARRTVVKAQEHIHDITAEGAADANTAPAPGAS